MNATLDSIIQFAFATLLNSLWLGILIALAAALILRLVPQMNATTRTSVLTAALIASLVVPIATTVATVSRPAAPVKSGTAVSTPALHTSRALVHTHIAHGHAAPNLTHENPSSGSRFNLQRLHLVIPRPIVLALVSLWLAAALIALIRLTVSLLHLERLKHDALPLAIDYRARMDRWTRAAKGGRNVRLCRSHEIVIPIAVGLFDAMILVPEALIDELSPDDIDRILLHELAHLRRGDDWVNALERIAQALLFFNPGIQWIIGRLDLEREVVCDDWVLAQTAEIRQYATCLARVAEITAWPYRAMAAPGAFITRRSMSVRIERLLEAGRDIRIRTSFGPAGIAVLTIAVLCIAAAFVSPSVAYPVASAPSHVANSIVRAKAERVAVQPHEQKHAAAPAQITVAKTTPSAEPAVVPTTAATRAVSSTPKPVAGARVFTQAKAQEKVWVDNQAQVSEAEHVAATFSPTAYAMPHTQIVAEASSSDYIDELASVGYRNLALDDLIRLKSVGVNAQYIRDIENAGVEHPSVEQLVQMAAVGVTGDYIRQMRQEFTTITPGDAASLKAVGVTGAYIGALRAAGYSNLSVDDVRSMSAVGVDPAYIRSMRGSFPSLSAGDLRRMRAVGVTPQYIADLNAAGYRNLTAEQATQLRALGIDGDFIRNAAAHGFRDLTIDQLIRLKTSGIL